MKEDTASTVPLGAARLVHPVAGQCRERGSAQFRCYVAGQRAVGVRLPGERQSARFYSTDGTPVPSNAGVWWRGRISEISGIVIGILGVGE
jgi:hypothetical protein